MSGSQREKLKVHYVLLLRLYKPNTTPNFLTVIPMESTTDDPTVDAAGYSSSASSSATLSRWKFAISQRFQHLLDKSTPYLAYRWIAFLCIAFIYAVRVYFVQGFYVVSYALGIYLLNLVVAFLSPQEDPELSNAPTLPIRSSEEFRPFVRRLPEFQFWYSITKAFCIAFVLTFFSIFDVPVFWPILLFYWVMLCTVMLRRQLLHMMKYKYVPFSVGNKQRYNRKRESSPESNDAPLV